MMSATTFGHNLHAIAATESCAADSIPWAMEEELDALPSVVVDYMKQHLLEVVFVRGDKCFYIAGGGFLWEKLC